VWSGLARTALASAVMGALLAVWLQSTSGRSPWIVGLGGVALGGAVFAAAAFALRVPEARLLPRMVLERLRR